MNIVCVICSESLTPSDDVFYTPCGHIFHFHCVTQWLERSRTCPQCREKVTQSRIHRIYFNFSNTDSILEDATSLQAMVDSLKFQLLVKERETKQSITKYDTCKKETAGLRSEVRKLENELTHKDTAILALKEQTRFFKDQSMEAENAKKEVARLKKKLDEFRRYLYQETRQRLDANVQILINAPSEDVDEMISNTRDPTRLLTYISVMKRELTTSVARRKELRTSLKKLQQELTKVSMERNFLSEEHSKRRQLEEMLAIAESEKYSLENRVRELESGQSAEKPTNVATQKPAADGLTSKIFDVDSEIEVEETACSRKQSLDIIDLSEDSPLERKIRRLRKDDVVEVSPSSEQRGNEENSPLAGCKYNISEELSKRKSWLIRRNSAFSFLAKKPRLAQTTSVERPSTDMSYDGFGGHSRDDKFPSRKRNNRELRKPSRAATRKPKLDAGNNRKLGDFVNLDRAT